MSAPDSQDVGLDILSPHEPQGKQNRSAANAGLWVGVSVLVTQVVLLVNSVIMARMLTPAEFGLVELCITIALFVNILGENGLSAEIVQQKELSQVYLSTAYWSNLGLGVVLSVAGIAVLWAIPGLADDPASRQLFTLTLLNFAANGAGIVQRVLLVRDLNFARLAYIEIAGIVVFVLASAGLALLGVGAEAYIIGWLLRTVLTSVLLFFSVSWRPTKHFAWHDLHSMAAFGANVFAGRVLVYANSNVDRFVIWRVLGEETLGFYSLSRRMPTGIASLLYSIVLRVTYPLMARQQQDQQKLNQMYLRTVSLLAILVLPPMALLTVLAGPVVYVVFGSEWAPAIFATRMMAMTPLFVIINLPSDSAFQAIGRPDLVWKNYVMRLALYLVFLAVAAPYGLDVIAAATLLYVMVAAILTHAFVKRVLGITWGSLIAAVVDPLRNSIIAAFAALVLLWMTQGVLPLALQLLLAGGTGAIVYMLAFRLLNADEMGQMCDLVGGAVNRPVVGIRLRSLFQLQAVEQ